MRRVKFYSDWVLFLHCREIGKSQLHMIRNLDGVFANSSESVDPEFDRMEVNVLKENTFLLTFYNSIKRTLKMRIFRFEKINGFKFLNFKDLKEMKNIMLYELGHFDSDLYFAVMKEGSQDMVFHRITFFDNSITIGRGINTRVFLDDTSIDNWACRPYNEDRLVCALIF